MPQSSCPARARGVPAVAMIGMVLIAIVAPGAPAVWRQPAATSPLVGPPLARLEQRAAHQIVEPDERAKASPAPPGAEAAMLGGPSRDSASSPRAGEELDRVLARHLALAIEPARGGAPDGHVSPPGEEGFAAARLYVQARQKFLDHEYEGTIEDLEAAIALDECAPTLWVLLGEARLRSGDEQRGMGAMARSVELGCEHPRPLLLLCTWNVTSGSVEAAIHLGARSVAADGMGDDPALRHMAWAALGDALHAGGYHRAAARAYTLGFDLPASFPAGTSYGTEMSSMYRGAWDALFRAGLGATAVEDWALAESALGLATRFRGVDDARALPLHVMACVRQGRPASAALAVLDAVERSGTAVGERTRRLIRHLRDHTSEGPLLAAALSELDARVRGRSASIEASLAMAVAAGLPDGLDRGPLAEGVQRFPSNVELIGGLMSSFGPGEQERAIEVAASIAAAHPVFAQSVADAMIAAGLRGTVALDALARAEAQPGAALLLARLLIEGARFDEARAVLERTGGGDAVGHTGGDLGAARRFLAATLESLAGNPDRARRVVEAWPAPENPGQRLLLVRSLQVIGDPAAAAQAAGEPEPTDEAGRALLWHACQSARSQADYDATERMALRIIESDPFAEGGYGVLIGLYSPAGPKASQQRLGETVRGLRERVPDSGLLRFLSARELAQAGRLAEADSRLRALAEDKPQDDAVLRALIEVWTSRQTREGGAHLAGGELFLRRLADRSPNTAAPVAALASLCLAQGRPEDAVRPVIGWLDRGLISTADDRNRWRGLIEPMLRRATSGPDPTTRSALLGVWSAMDRAGVALDAPMHQGRLVLLTQTAPFDDEAIVQAATRAADQVPSLNPVAFRMAAGSVLQAGRPDLALALMKAGGQRPGGWSSQDTALWVGLVAQHGDADDLRDVLEATPNAQTLATILRALPGAADEPAGAIERVRGDLAYAVAGATRVLDRPEGASESFLRLALELFPEHESAANDLGYQLADRGVSLEEAERLLEMAHRLQPEEANVLDSLGWLRYKQGRLSDLTDPSGAVVPGGEGAITLLERASQSVSESAGPVTLDQLGDALWRAGRHEDALARWRGALPLAERTVEAYRTAGAPGLLLGDAQRRLERIRAKVSAVEGGSAPEVAPLGEGVTGVR